MKVPIELQNKSMVVKGWIRVTNEASNETDMQQPASICAVKADVTPDLRFGPAGWNLDERNCGVGRHHASCLAILLEQPSYVIMVNGMFWSCVNHWKV